MVPTCESTRHGFKSVVIDVQVLGHIETELFGIEASSSNPVILLFNLDLHSHDHCLHLHRIHLFHDIDHMIDSTL